jgi:uncharacterized protein YrzB (UPF0473 family)
MSKEHNCGCGDDNLEKDKCCSDNKEEKCCESQEEHNHEGCGEGCGCGHDHEHSHEVGEDTMMVTFDDGEEKECLVLAVVEIDEKEYVALLPEGQEEYFIYGYKEDEKGVELLAIESDKEFEKVGSVFEEIFGGEEDEEEEDEE